MSLNGMVGPCSCPTGEGCWDGASVKRSTAMSNKSIATIATMGIDIGKNSFHVVGLDRRGAIVLRQKWSRGQIEARLAALDSSRYRCRALGVIKDLHSVAGFSRRPSPGELGSIARRLCGAIQQRVSDLPLLRFDAAIRRSHKFRPDRIGDRLAQDPIDLGLRGGIEPLARHLVNRLQSDRDDARPTA